MTNNERKAMADYKIHIPSNRLYEIFEMIKALPTENKYQKQRKEILETNYERKILNWGKRGDE